MTRDFVSMVYEGVLVGCGHEVFSVFGYAFSKANGDGTVQLHPTVLSLIFGGEDHETEKAIEYLVDVNWLIPVEGCDDRYALAMYDELRDSFVADRRRAKNRNAVAIFRANQKTTKSAKAGS